MDVFWLVVESGKIRVLDQLAFDLVEISLELDRESGLLLLCEKRVFLLELGDSDLALFLGLAVF